MPEITVQLDNRVRLVGIALAASRWPDQEAAGRAVHPVAALGRHFVSDFAQHPAALTANQAVAQAVSLRGQTDSLPYEAALAALFAAALRASWPTLEAQEPLPPKPAGGRWLAHLADFYTETAVAAFFWADHDAVWQEAGRDLAEILGSAGVSPAPPGNNRPLILVPNFAYPTDRPLLATTQAADYLILPPPAAHGAPPGRFRDQPAAVLAALREALKGH